ncbi:potassium channel family protein [Streptomyces sp. NPDC004244]|uniref:potassium channel family protein n=1 Tax=Streptomyces sp. NPDC101206 TaxID=3366128 RepID=UPI003824E914
MTAGTGTVPQNEPEDWPSFRRIIWTALRVVGSVAVLVALYYVVPLDRSSMGSAIAMLLTGLVGFVVLVAVQVTSVLRSRYPWLRAVEALAVSVPFFVLLFAAAYVAMAAQSPGSFGRRLSHTNGIYFAISVFSTVGFGDFTARSEAAQLVVTGQMLSDLAVFGLAIKVIVNAARQGRQRKSTMATAAREGDAKHRPRPD